MRVLITSPHFYPAKLGGPANTLYWLSKGLIKQNIEVSVVATGDAIDTTTVRLNQWNIVDGIKVRYCFARTRLALRVIWHSILEMERCQLVMLSSISFLPNFFIALYACVKKKRIILSPRGELLPCAMEGERLKLLYIFVLKHLAGSKMFFHATSEEEKKCILYFFGPSAKIEVVPNYMEVPPLIKGKSMQERYFLFMGRINPIKALDNLILGCSKSEQFLKSDYKLFLAGPNQGSYIDKLKGLVKELNLENKIYFTGRVEGDEKFQLYSNAYFSCLVSHSENFGNVVIEALSQGTPVIASFGTPWNILEVNHAGFWIENSPEGIAACLDAAILLSADQYKLYRENALRLSSEFDIYKNVGKWISFIRKV